MSGVACASPAGARLEVCVDSLQSATAAEEGGADAVELCAALSEGGLTPSAGMIHACVRLLRIPVRVLIRPRGGDFVYCQEELQAMLQDIGVCADAGAEGVVIGALTPGGEVDLGQTSALVSAAAARSLRVTFHRAFDHCRDPHEGLQALLSVGGIQRLLTSGQRRTAVEGAPVIAALARESRGRIQVMAGGGVSAANVGALLESTACPWVHGSFRAWRAPVRCHRNPECPLGAGEREDGLVLQTSAGEVRAAMAVLMARGSLVHQK